MGKSKPVTMTNGRQWAKMGDAKKHFSDMLNRYSVGDRVVAEDDHSDLLALVTAYDSAAPQWNGSKTGEGVDHFVKDYDDEIGRTQFKSKCFFVVRTDGTRVHFSTNSAVDAIA